MQSIFRIVIWHNRKHESPAATSLLLNRIAVAAGDLWNLALEREIRKLMTDDLDLTSPDQDEIDGKQRLADEDQEENRLISDDFNRWPWSRVTCHWDWMDHYAVTIGDI